MNHLKKKEICFLLSNDATRDPRVSKEAKSAVDLGLKVTILSFYWHSDQNKYSKKEYRDEIFIYRGEYFPTVWDFRYGYFNNLIIKIMNILVKIISYNVYNYYLSMTKFFVRKGTESKFDIVHANDLDTLMAGYLIKKKTGAKLVYDAHEIWTDSGLTLPWILISIFNIIEKIFLRKTDAFISVNRSILREILQRHKISYQGIMEPIYNCPRYIKHSLKKKQEQKIKILYQGGCIPGRGIEELGLAARFLPDNAQVIIRALGSQDIINKVKEIKKKYRLGNKLVIDAPVAPEKLIDSARKADIGVIANQPNNINNYLVAPNKLFEYMTAGLALAVSDLPELNKIIKENKNGVVFDSTRPECIANALKKIIRNPEKLQKMKQNSLRAARKYNWENEEIKLRKIYKELL